MEAHRCCRCFIYVAAQFGSGGEGALKPTRFVPSESRADSKQSLAIQACIGSPDMGYSAVQNNVEVAVQPMFSAVLGVAARGVFAAAVPEGGIWAQHRRKRTDQRAKCREAQCTADHVHG